jgi:hypothetical protein
MKRVVEYADVSLDCLELFLKSIGIEGPFSSVGYDATKWKTGVVIIEYEVEKDDL